MMLGFSEFSQSSVNKVAHKWKDRKVQKIVEIHTGSGDNLKEIWRRKQTVVEVQPAQTFSFHVPPEKKPLPQVSE